MNGDSISLTAIQADVVSAGISSQAIERVQGVGVLASAAAVALCRATTLAVANARLISGSPHSSAS